MRKPDDAVRPGELSVSYLGVAPDVLYVRTGKKLEDAASRI